MEVTKFSFDEIDMLARTISKRAKQHEGFTHVVGIARGGLVPATIVSYELGLPLTTVSVSSYEGKERKGIVGNCHGLFDLPKNSKLLIVDDICDSGQTINWIKNELSVAEIKYEIACVFIKKQHKNKIKFYGSIVNDDKWIVFPWE
jgi:hypoxanthine phosphoribosyltransferase